MHDDWFTLSSQRANQTVLIDASSNRSWTWADLDALTSQIANWLANYCGLGENDVLLSLLPNSVETLSIFLACLKGGIGYAPLPPSATAREISRLRSVLTPKHVISLVNANEQTNAALFDVPRTNLQLDGKFSWLQNADTSPLRGSPVGRLFIATSGSTGNPKLMAINGDTLWSAGKAFVEHHSFLGRRSRFYNIMPMSYLGGLFNLGLIPLASGGSVVISKAFAGSTVIRFWHEVSLHNVNILWLVPTMIRSLISITGSRWKTDEKKINVVAAFLGTAPIDLATKQNFETIFGIPLLENYALSETTFMTSETLESRHRRLEGSVGAVLPWVQLRFVPTDNKESSRIQVRTPFLFEGYREESTLQRPADADGWFDTGDLGHLDSGCLILDGRERDIIKKGGVLVHLSEIASIVREMPHVADVAAIDVPHEFYGEDYALFVVFTPESADLTIDQSERVRSFLIDNLVNTKWPSYIATLSEIPRTHSGKVDRPALRQMATQKAL
jgi:acyl-CoA synthetase (AMP-forming)/AMP-acid ligase II